MAKKTKARTFLGMPMNWDRRNMFTNGGTVNFHALFRTVGLIAKPARKKK